MIHAFVNRKLDALRAFTRASLRICVLDAAIRVNCWNCAAAHLCQPKQIMIKVKQQPNDGASNYTEQNLHKLSSCAFFFADNFREFATLN